MKKQRLFLLLSVMLLLLAGCGKKGNRVTEQQSVEAESQTVLEEETDSTKENETAAVTEKPEETPEVIKTEESTPAEESTAADSGQEAQPSGTEEKKQDSGQNETAEEPSQPQTQVQETKPEPEPQEPEQPLQPEPVSYSPEHVVQLATEKVKAGGKVYIPDDLDRMLSEGTLSQEDYNDCYPTDGAGYLEFYVAADLNEARDVSGTVKFDSEDDIAANIAGIYASLPQQYFYIEYHGTVMYGGRECYVFYCYRA